MSETLSITIAIIGLVCTVLSIIFVIMTFSKNTGKDKTMTEVRLAKIEVDVQYIRESLDKSEKWHTDIEKRIDKLEKRK